MAYTKIIQSGSIIEQWTYEKEPNPDRLVRKKPRIRRTIHRERRADNIKKCKAAFTRLVRANLSPSKPPFLLTLTMRSIVSIDEAYRSYTAFGKRLRTRYGQGISWVAVPEFQKRGAVHFHVLVFDLPYEAYSNERRTRSLANLWGEGFCDIRKTDASPKLASYLGKYMSKAMQDLRLVGKRGYSASRNVLRPVSLNTAFSVRTFRELWGLTGDNSLVKEREYDTMFLGRCIYKQFNVENTHENSDHRS